MDLVVVGAGLFGLTIADLAARGLGLKVTVIDVRPHIGGNAFDYVDVETGIEIHKYGSHIFHTDNERIWKYVNRFTSFTNYDHRVFTKHNNKTYPMPINLATINQFFELSLSPDEARSLIKSQTGSRQPSEAENLRDKAISMIGEPLYDAFIKGYTAKQWQTDPEFLSPDIISRLPVRFTYDTRYFGDKYQGLPVNGYTNWFSRMINHKNIEVITSTDFFSNNVGLSKNETVGQVPIVYTGPIDRYFDYVEGELGWRTLDFEIQRHDTGDFQGVAVMNYADNDVPFTRVHEFKHFHPHRIYTPGVTITMKEVSKFARSDDEPYYPINTPDDRNKLKAYRTLEASEPKVLFGGRLGSYQYLDMHMAIASAHSRFESVVSSWFKSSNLLT